MYDSDVSTYDSTGKVYQVLYAQEAPKQGSPIVAIAVGQTVVLAAATSSISKLAIPQPKIFEIQQNIYVAVSGIYSDAKKDVQTARDLSDEYVLQYNTKLPILNLVQDMASQAQQRTQISSSRPHGAGLLFAGIEEEAFIFYTDPSAEYRKFKAYAIGRNAQAANAFLVKNYDVHATEEKLVEIAVRGLQKAFGEELKGIEVVVINQQGSFKKDGLTELRKVQEKFPEVEDCDSD
ncbi:20S proteasome alpha subunit 6 [Spironucleus salmonicida]|uniref:20S proteasome alpha subunit 6 n=1 Tax=Spironucleus salmonicida TaxID=348837 RepID=V6LYQ7_9EUKA|nr:20S proteasome alpha subunit 6 [Spironucleus salmonicida]|eukprot:EST45959.1 20S proteasome alpha subunit 6 [Spironucleus salmonicida]